MSTDLILGLIFFVLSVLTSLKKKTYFEVPLGELRKRSASGEDVNKDIIKALTYGGALRTLLWLMLGLSSSLSLTLLSLALPLWLSVIVVGCIIYFIFSYLPGTRVTRLDTSLTKLTAPALNWILKRTSKYLDGVYAPLAKRYTSPSSNIFDTEDLLNFLKVQSRYSDQRIEPEAFLILERSLAFGSIRVSDLMTPAKKVKKMLESDVIGPILINELHEAKDSFAVVRAEPKGDITGLLTMADVSIRSQGRVDSHMQKDVCFVNKNDYAAIVIKSFYDTKHQVFVVVDDNKKFMGTISLGLVIKQIVGPLDNVVSQNTDDLSSEGVAKLDDSVVE